MSLIACKSVLRTYIAMMSNTRKDHGFKVRKTRKVVNSIFFQRGLGVSSFLGEKITYFNVILTHKHHQSVS